jgi:oligopeptide/dipeptide ABC transporter ATP-binding protein
MPDSRLTLQVLSDESLAKIEETAIRLLDEVGIALDHRRASGRQRIILTGEIPSPRNPPPGCAFHPRCRYAEARCATEEPLLRMLPGTSGWVACHFPERVRSL